MLLNTTYNLQTLLEKLPSAMASSLAALKECKIQAQNAYNIDQKSLI